MCDGFGDKYKLFMEYIVKIWNMENVIVVTQHTHTRCNIIHNWFKFVWIISILLQTLLT